MAKVVVLATGGTIASSAAAGGGAVARHTASEILTEAAPTGVQVEARDLLSLNSFLIGHRELRLIAEAVTGELAREDVAGVVLTHGTDTMEETAFLLDLVTDGEKPVVLTGAQRSADQPDSDGPRNVRDAVAVAASGAARGCGALIVFGGLLYPACRTRKHHTIAPAPFRVADGGPLGRVGADGVHVHSRPVRGAALPVPGNGFDTTRVDVVSVYPGADAALARAAVSNGASAVVLAGTGAGNANHAILDWVRGAVGAGVVVAVSTRVAEGPVLPIYGNGGAVDLLAAGALNMRGLPLYHSRLLLALLLSSGEDVTQEVIDRHA